MVVVVDDDVVVGLVVVEVTFRGTLTQRTVRLVAAQVNLLHLLGRRSSPVSRLAQATKRTPSRIRISVAVLPTQVSPFASDNRRAESIHICGAGPDLGHDRRVSRSRQPALLARRTRAVVESTHTTMLRSLTRACATAMGIDVHRTISAMASRETER